MLERRGVECNDQSVWGGRPVRLLIQRKNRPIRVFAEARGAKRDDGKHQEYRLANGLRLLSEPVIGVRSVAVTLLTSGGLIHEADHESGLANLTVAMATRGAGDRSSREFVDWQDSLGLQRTEGAETAHASISCASVADRLESSLELIADIVQRPHLPADQLDLCKAGILQEIDAMEDDPGQKLFVHLRQASLPGKLGRRLLGLTRVSSSYQSTMFADSMRTTTGRTRRYWESPVLLIWQGRVFGRKAFWFLAEQQDDRGGRGLASFSWSSRSCFD